MSLSVLTVSADRSEKPILTAIPMLPALGMEVLYAGGHRIVERVAIDAPPSNSVQLGSAGQYGRVDAVVIVDCGAPPLTGEI